MEPKFIWRKSLDILGRNLDEFPEYVDENDEETISEYEKMEQKEEQGQKHLPHFILTQYGLLAAKPYHNPCKNFNFWELHCNFNLTEKMMKAVDETVGVEIFNGISPCRIRVAIGLAFDVDLVKGDVKKAIFQFLPKTEAAAAGV